MKLYFKQYINEGIEIDTPEAKELRRLVDTGEYRSGDCYVCSRRFAMKINGDYVEGVLMGGYPRRKILHAWVEKDGFVYDPTTPEALPKEEYYKIYNAKSHYKADGVKATLKSSRENKPGPVGEVPEGFEFKDNVWKSWLALAVFTITIFTITFWAIFMFWTSWAGAFTFIFHPIFEIHNYP